MDTTEGTPTTVREALLLATGLLDHWRTVGDDPDRLDDYERELEERGVRPGIILLTMQADARQKQAVGKRLRVMTPQDLAVTAHRLQLAMHLAGGDVTSFQDELQELTDQAREGESIAFLDGFVRWRAAYTPELDRETAEALDRMAAADRDVVVGLARSYLRQLLTATGWYDGHPATNLRSMVQYLHQRGTCGVRLPSEDERHAPMPMTGWPWQEATA